MKGADVGNDGGGGRMSALNGGPEEITGAEEKLGGVVEGRKVKLVGGAKFAAGGRPGILIGKAC